MSQMKSKSAHMGSRLSLLRVSCLLARLLLVCPHSSGRGRSEVSRHDYRTLNETVLFEGMLILPLYNRHIVHMYIYEITLI